MTPHLHYLILRDVVFFKYLQLFRVFLTDIFLSLGLELCLHALNTDSIELQPNVEESETSCHCIDGSDLLLVDNSQTEEALYHSRGKYDRLSSRQVASRNSP